MLEVVENRYDEASCFNRLEPYHKKASVRRKVAHIYSTACAERKCTCTLRGTRSECSVGRTTLGCAYTFNRIYTCAEKKCICIPRGTRSERSVGRTTLCPSDGWMGGSLQNCADRQGGAIKTWPRLEVIDSSHVANLTCPDSKENYSENKRFDFHCY